jgi:hypothetical protein
MARSSDHLRPGESELTVVSAQGYQLEDSQWGPMAYIDWCRLESERINATRSGRNMSRVYENDGFSCCVLIMRRPEL